MTAQNPLFKTVICSNWEQGECKFGDKCSFAHGKEELRVRPNSLFKTVICTAWMDGECKFGDRCNFAHGEDEIRQRPRKMPMPKPKPISKIKKASFVFHEEDFPTLTKVTKKSLKVEEVKSKMNPLAPEFVPRPKVRVDQRTFGCDLDF